MTETPDPPESPEIEQVRRLLAEARHTEPMPDDVVARMDDVLAGLRDAQATTHEAPTTSAEEPTAEPTAEVVPLARRRRLRAAGWLVAAAVVVVGGVTLAQHLPESSSPGTASAGAESAPDRSPEAPSAAGGNVGEAQAPTELLGGRLVVRPNRFAHDALAGRQLLQSKSYDAQHSLRTTPCAAVPTGAGQVLIATYQGARAALVYRPPSGNTQVVDLYLCRSSDVVRSATLPAP